jgi:hypothetical protein
MRMPAPTLSESFAEDFVLSSTSRPVIHEDHSMSQERQLRLDATCSSPGDTKIIMDMDDPFKASFSKSLYKTWEQATECLVIIGHEAVNHRQWKACQMAFKVSWHFTLLTGTCT